MRVDERLKLTCNPLPLAGSVGILQPCAAEFKLTCSPLPHASSVENLQPPSSFSQ